MIGDQLNTDALDRWGVRPPSGGRGAFLMGRSSGGSRGGLSRSENADMSSAKARLIRARRKPKVS
jgi:hypothetical protein